MFFSLFRVDRGQTVEVTDAHREHVKWSEIIRSWSALITSSSTNSRSKRDSSEFCRPMFTIRACSVRSATSLVNTRIADQQHVDNSSEVHFVRLLPVSPNDSEPSLEVKEPPKPECLETAIGPVPEKSRENIKGNLGRNCKRV